MHWRPIENEWTSYRHKAQRRWTNLTDNQLEIIDGRLDALVELVRRSYAIPPSAAEQQVHDWAATFEDEYVDMPGEHPTEPRVRQLIRQKFRYQELSLTTLSDKRQS
jgi:hypothetical protein